MDNNDILTLAKAGFTAQQIAALNAISAPTVQVTPTTPNNAGMVTSTGTAVPPVPPVASPMDAMTQQLQALTQAVQGSSLLSANQPAPQTTDDVLASILNPADDKPLGGAQ